MRCSPPAGAASGGICGVGVLRHDQRLHEVLQRQDGLYTLVVKHADGSRTARVVGSLLEHLLAPDDPRRWSSGWPTPRPGSSP
jgi:mannitol 2-dehydrogenase